MKYYRISFPICLIVFCSCSQFVETGPPRNSLVPAQIFSSNELALSAVLGQYEQMSRTGYSSGGLRSITLALGLSADEFLAYGQENLQILHHELTTDNNYISSLWSGMYKRIYNINAILEGLRNSDNISDNLKSQLTGELLFLRAFHYFYLGNIFGPVPLHLTTDYKLNTNATRTPLDSVYYQILVDLNAAESLLTDNYPSAERIRPNKSTVHALQARVYLFLEEWDNAQHYSNLVLGKVDVYQLLPLDQVFLKNSLESIWQIQPMVGQNTPSGSLFILTAPPLGTQVALRPEFISDTVESEDKRKVFWVDSVTNGGSTFYYPFKYKVRASSIVTEYHSIFRLSEQYLIRAEARVHLNDRDGAIEDIDKIRSRAGLSTILDHNPDISDEELLVAIHKERHVELFSEWGHRWLDLKRTNRINDVLSSVKLNWSPDFILFPIPRSETERNPNIYPNQGY
ncbi:RagB/SusD family nutrient uptake outer membrane protein [Parapedobacter sp. 2B3]|uniref:RagB/SusD family nutrient uptake outer membrane protein n=1 Tax=Parapedobacter sp. 2B3 TaxID=3342381 RepID=UPI0035B5B03F